MKSLVRKKQIYIVALPVMLLLGSGCKKMFDIQPEQNLDREQMYRDVYDADAAVLGLYGKLLNLAEQQVVLNELRADLMDVTSNASEVLKEVNEHTVTLENPYANPKPFFETILNCNDVIKNFRIMYTDKKLSTEQFQQRYGDVVALRSWVYLQAGIQFGTVPYITDALETVDAVKDESRFTRLGLERLIDTLIKTTDSIPYKDPYTATTSLVTIVDGYNTSKFFIHKKCLLGDLYLWRSAFTKSAADARTAAQYYKDVMNTDKSDAGETYRVKYSEVLSNSDLAIGYYNDGRVNQYNENALVNSNSLGWRSMFARAQDGLYNQEWIWMLYFDKSFAPKNPFINLFSNRGGSYLVKPSQTAITAWNSQVQSENNFRFDGRGKLTYTMLDGQPVIMKYLYNYLDETTSIPVRPLEKPGKWFLYRAALLHLHYAEAANRDGRHRLAYALVNDGIKANYTDPALPTDVTNSQQTFDVEPYAFDARLGEVPRFRSAWYKNAGIRGRAHLKVNPVAAGSDSTLAIENQIIDEQGLELAYEGHRWADLLRISIRRDDPAFIADKVYEKLQKGGNGKAAEVRARLMARNWFLPFKW
ncbi:hypothetical protein HNQ91_000240 [Filimonas zeae]|nr:RagB/SusD family nutrient uptake outer membrane protein [Filimonas zeae]MDR6337218.1 hypothetical protein [Filimonas zeae]